MGVGVVQVGPLGVKGKDAATIHDANNPIATEDQVSKDWDEADRAKVNPIVGQAGVAANAGAVDAKTLRVIPATESLTGVKGADGATTASNSNPLPAAPIGVQPDGDRVAARADGQAFQDSTALGIDGVFTSDWHDSDGHKGIELFIATDQLSATNGIEVQYTDDAQAVTPTVRGEITKSYRAADVSRGFIVLYLPTMLDGFRVKYTNGATAQTSFFVAATLRTSPIENPQGPVDGDFTATENVMSARAVLTTKDSVSGIYENVESAPASDDVPNPDTGLNTLALSMGYDDDITRWVRIRARQPVDSMTNPGRALNASSFQMLWNPDGTPANRWNRMIGKPLADGQAEQLAALVGSRLQLWNGTGWDRAPGDTTNGLDVDVTRSALPTGASTAAKQDAQTTELQQIEADLEAINADLGEQVDAEATGDGSLIAIAKRLRTLLGNIDANTDGLEGQLTTLIAEVDGLEEAIGTTADLATANTVIGRLKEIANDLDVALSTRASEATVASLLSEAAFQARINTLGQKTSANSTPVVLPSDQTVPVSGPLTDTELRATDVAVTLAGEQVDVSDRAARDLGKVDVASLDQYTPTDVDSGAGSENAVPVSWRKTASGGSAEFGTSSDPVRTDPTGTTTQPVSDASRSGELQAGTETAVSSTAILIYTANADDKEVTVQNVGSGVMRIGPSGVSATTGFRLNPGGHKVYSDPVTTNDLYAIRDGSTDTTALVQAVR